MEGLRAAGSTALGTFLQTHIRFAISGVATGNKYPAPL